MVEQNMNDTVFMSSSPWTSDLWMSKDSLLPSDGDLGCDLLPFDQFEVERDQTSQLLSWKVDDYPSSSYHSSDISVANSECSDELSLEIHADLEDGILQNAPVAAAEFLSLTVLGPPPQDDKQQDIDSSLVYLDPDRWQYDLSEEEEDDGYDDDDDDDNSGFDNNAVNRPTTPSMQQINPSLRNQSLSETLNHNIKWNLLDTREQHQLVEDLTEVISTHLGLREQLEVIQIINPHVSVSPTDTQFVIDMSELNNEKLDRVQSFVKSHLNAANNNHHCNHDNTNSSSRASKGHHHSKSCSRFCCHDNHSCGTVSEESNNGKTNRRQRRTAKPTVRQRRQEQRKRSRQDRKEKRSGLFVREQILSVSVASQDAGDEVEDIDILT